MRHVFSVAGSVKLWSLVLAISLSPALAFAHADAPTAKRAPKVQADAKEPGAPAPKAAKAAKKTNKNAGSGHPTGKDKPAVMPKVSRKTQVGERTRKNRTNSSRLSRNDRRYMRGPTTAKSPAARIGNAPQAPVTGNQGTQPTR